MQSLINLTHYQPKEEMKQQHGKDGEEEAQGSIYQRKKMVIRMQTSQMRRT
uniref:Uncharacterized protein n=1 Tax=Arundo donax TaxID=35708 RepID=A0A0A9BHQ8_ARUDO